MAASVKQKILDGTRRYLAVEHAQDPAAHPAEIKAIAAHVGVNRGVFYNWLKKDDAEMRALVQAIEAADADAAGGTKPRLSLAATGADGASAAVSTAELEREIREGLERVVWQMKAFLSLMANSSGVAEAPLHMAELDAKLRACRAIYAGLEVPYREWDGRRKMVVARALPSAETDCLLDFGAADGADAL